VTRSAAGCRIYLPTKRDDRIEYPGRILNDDGTIAKKLTVGQEEAVVVDEGGEVDAPVRAPVIATVSRNAMSDSRTDDDVSSITHHPDVAGMGVEPAGTVHRRPEMTSTPSCPLQLGRNPECSGNLPEPPVARGGIVATAEPSQVIVLFDEFGRDTCVVNEICQMIEGMPRPWSAYRAFGAAIAQFPNIDRAALRLTVLAVLMGQRRCINRMTMAGMLSGPRCDEDGEIYLELNNSCADEYRNSF